MRALCAGLFLALSLSAYAASDNSQKVAGEVGLCQLMNDFGAYEGTVVTFEALLAAGAHPDDMVLSDQHCPKRHIFLSVDKSFREDEVFMSTLKYIYPDYPDRDTATDNNVRVKVTGKLVSLINRNLSMAYLELQRLSPMR